MEQKLAANKYTEAVPPITNQWTSTSVFAVLYIVPIMIASIHKGTHVGQVSLFGAFCSFLLGGRQPACVQKNKNPSKIQGCPMRSSSAGAEMPADKKKSAENTLCILKGFDAV